MKKYVSHIIYLVIIVFFVTYANIKAKEASKQTEIAQEQIENASEWESLAEASMAEAMMQKRVAVETSEENKKLQAQLKACQGK